MAISAGLPRKGIYAFRRNMGNDACALPLLLLDSRLFIFILACYHRRKGGSGNAPRSYNFGIAPSLLRRHGQSGRRRVVSERASGQALENGRGMPFFFSPTDNFLPLLL